MILAREKPDYRSWETEKAAPRKMVRKAPKLHKKTQKGYLLIVILAFILGLTVASRYTHVAVMGYQLSKLNVAMSSLEKENQLLNVEVNQLKSLDRIEKIATTRLGMVAPQNVQFIAIKNGPGNAYGPDQAGNGQLNGVQGAKPGLSQGVLGVLTSLFQQWDKGSTPVEANTGQ